MFKLNKCCSQVFGARKLNTNEDSENMLGRKITLVGSGSVLEKAWVRKK